MRGGSADGGRASSEERRRDGWVRWLDRGRKRSDEEDDGSEGDCEKGGETGLAG